MNGDLAHDLIHYRDNSVTLLAGDCLTILATMADCSVDAIVTDPPYGLEFMGKEWDSFGVGKRPAFREPDGTPFRQNRGTPLFTDPGNPSCRNCGGDKYRNGPRKCVCDVPDFGNQQGESMRGFQSWCVLWAAECYRVLKPGSYLAAFGGSRTVHRLAAGIEDAGFEFRGFLAWLYGSGFPKSMDVAKAIDKSTGFVGDVVGFKAVDIGMQSNQMHTGRKSVFVEQEVRELSHEAGQWRGWGTALKPSFEPIVLAYKP